jgi:hypothetical protein
MDAPILARGAQSAERKSNCAAAFSEERI